MTVIENIDNAMVWLKSDKNISLREYLFSEQFIKELEEDVLIMKDGNYPSGMTAGAYLEAFTKKIFLYNSMFEVKTNIRTSTNEIDLLVTWSPSAQMIRSLFYPDLSGEKFVIECKNYNKTVGVTWVGKFYSLLRMLKIKNGIIISKEKLTGRSDWSDAIGLSKKIALRDDSLILNISFYDLHLLKEMNLFDLILHKKEEIERDISFQYLITPHPCEE